MLSLFSSSGDKGRDDDCNPPTVTVAVSAVTAAAAAAAASVARSCWWISRTRASNSMPDV